jgi:YVTN family beta-propeller protein
MLSGGVAILSFSELIFVSRTCRRQGVRPLRAGVAFSVMRLWPTASQAEPHTKAYVVHTAANLVTAIDTSTRTVAATIPVGTAPVAVAVTRDGTRAYVADRDSDSISIIDTASDTVAATIPVGDSPTAVAVTPDGSRLYVMTSGGVVQAIDATDPAQSQHRFGLRQCGDPHRSSGVDLPDL